MRIVNLASGSKANCTFVSVNDTKILIDVGLSEKKLKAELEEIDEHLNEINAVLITHEHIDHIRSLKVLAKKYDIKFYLHKNLADSDFLNDISFKENALYKFVDEKFLIGDIEITPFDISHDAIAPVGFVAKAKGSKSKVAFLTDVGEINDKIKSVISGSKYVFLESNYDENMLENGVYPRPVKDRIAGRFGHLSNKDSLELAKYLYSTGTKCFVLSHLSENNNTAELAYLNYVNFFKAQGLTLDKDVFVRLSFQHKHGNNFILKEEFDGK